VSVHHEPHYFVTCKQCDRRYDAGLAGSQVAARVRAGIAGWAFTPHTIRKDGTKLALPVDVCPDCNVVDAEIVDDPDTPSEAT
jgi:hypothetical protein